MNFIPNAKFIFLLNRHIQLNNLHTTDDTTQLRHFLFQCFKESKRTRITWHFLKEVMSKYLSVPPEAVVGLFTHDRARRYPKAHHVTRAKKPSRNLIDLIAHHKPTMFYVKPAPNEFTPDTKNKFLSRINAKVRFSPLTMRSPDKGGRLRGYNREGKLYREIVRTSNGTLFSDASQTPSGSHPAGEVNFSSPLSAAALKAAHPEWFEHEPSTTFSFQVTKDEVLYRSQAKRPCSQKQVTGYSAESFFDACGAIIVEKTRGSFYHLGHRHGWSLGGKQAVDNLDPATAGSNYSSLFYIESPLKKLLLEGECEVMTVNGVVKYHDELPLPEQITYELMWGNGRSAQVVIRPLEYDSPTKDEYNVVDALYRFIRTPKKSMEALPQDDLNDVKRKLSFLES